MNWKDPSEVGNVVGTVFIVWAAAMVIVVATVKIVGAIT